MSTRIRKAARAGVVATGALAAVASGCRDTHDATAGGDDLRRDLDAAAAAAAFAPAARGNAPVRFVSALELGAPPATPGTNAAPSPPRARQPRAAQHASITTRPRVVLVRVREIERAEPTAADAPAASAPAPERAEEVASAEASAGAGSYTPPTEVIVTPEPSGGSSRDGAQGRGGSIWGTIGGILGVVIRGGTIGDADHCERHGQHDSSGQRIPPRIPSRFPGVQEPGESITGTLQGEVGGRARGTVVIPFGRFIGAITRGRQPA